MNSIRVLPTETIAMIAAGQVIERPASVVKELVDNALDAGATHITVELQKGGTQRICVTDDGKGMTAEELLVCFLPHTTSKISNISELQTLQTLGFRGEGLASMVTVADVQIESRVRDAETGSALSITTGRPSVIQPIGMPHGTRVTVSRIFQRIPARKKFLKKEQAELRAVVELLHHYALIYPEKIFVLTNNDTTVLRTQHTERLDRIVEITALDDHHLLPFQIDGEYVTITGFIGTPQLAGRRVRDQYIFINNRPVIYPEIMKAVKESYKTLLEPYTQPVFYLDISVPQHMTDVNIDPKKEKLHLFHLPQVIETLYNGIQQTLKNVDIHYTVGSQSLDLADIGMETYTAKALRKHITPWSLKNITKNSEIIQVHDTYLIAQTSEGVMMIDQHAAHERILYEQFLEEFSRQQALGESAALETPQVITCSISQLALIKQYLHHLTAHGFTIVIDDQAKTVQITHVPTLFQKRELKTLIVELCEDWDGLLPSEKVDVVSHKTIAYLACRTAIKAGEVLTHSERYNLLQKLAKTKTQYTCPHGRPVQLTISLYEIEKMFHRK